MARIHVEVWQRVKRNFGLRMLALVIAASLWVFVNAAQHETEIGLTVPVQYTGLSPGLVIVNDHPQFVNLQISGPQTLLSLLDAGRMPVHLDLRGVTPGEADFKITASMFHVPRQTTIDRVSPAQITLDIDQIITKDLPVHLDTTGQVATGFQIASVEIQPPVVSVTGPARFLRNMGSVDTTPLDIEDISADLSREVPLADTGALIRVPVARVLANIHLGQVIVEREFRNLPIAVRNATQKSLVLPHTVSVSVRGPERSFDQLALNNSVYVDAQDLESGWYEAPVMVDLPKGMEVVREIPQKVKLHLFRR
jgi:YbbR domain-containing protein